MQGVQSIRGPMPRSSSPHRDSARLAPAKPIQFPAQLRDVALEARIPRPLLQAVDLSFGPVPEFNFVPVRVACSSDLCSLELFPKRSPCGGIPPPRSGDLVADVHAGIPTLSAGDRRRHAR